jgi:hypothetical protein
VLQIPCAIAERKLLHAELVGSNRCAIAGFTATSSAPILALCRTLIAAGFDPTTPMECYRNGVLALRIRAIGEAAALELNGEGAGFRPRRQPDAAPPIAPNAAGGSQEPNALTTPQETGVAQ